MQECAQIPTFSTPSTAKNVLLTASALRRGAATPASRGILCFEAPASSALNRRAYMGPAVAAALGLQGLSYHVPIASPW